MKRTKQWWNKLTANERSELHWLERYNSKWNILRSGRSSLIPDDCSECANCSTPHAGVGLCPTCSERLDELINKADNAIRRMVRKIEKKE